MAIALTVTGAADVRGDFGSGTLQAAVAAPDGSLLLAARYDANGRQDGVAVFTVEADRTVYDVAWTRQDGCAYKLLLLAPDTLAPLCAAWESGDGA